MITSSDHITLGVAAVRIGGGVQRHHLQRLISRGKIDCTKVGSLRLVLASDLPKIRAVCVACGYCKPEAEVAVSAK